MMKYKSAHSPRWADKTHSQIELVVDFEQLGPVPFAADPTDPADYGRELFSRAVAGDFGDIAPYVPPAVAAPVQASVPQHVTLAQARAALMQAGLYATVDSFVKSSNNAVLIMAWEYTNTVDRNGLFVTSLASELSLTETQLDALFTTAASIKF